MAKSVKSYRLGDVAVAKVEAIAKQRGVSESRVVEDFIMGQAKVAADNDRGSAAVARDRLRTSVVDPEKLAAFQRKAGMTVYDKRRDRR